ncbi:MAG: CAF17-like 4Fe-4S cluster assembly/insertion protein YgfZ [Gammaproteobacteria bacterium]
MHQITKLSHLKIVEISGDDAKEFLSNQFTSDVNALKDGEFQQSAWCNPKGRVLFAPFLYREQSKYYCLLTDDLVDQFCQRLKMFVLRSKVVIDTTDGLETYGFTLPHELNAKDILGEILVGDEITLVARENSGDAARRHYLIVAPANSLLKPSSDCKLSEDRSQWHHDQISAGLPEISAATSGHFLPQNLNLDALNSVSFSKGCYPGQEIVARLKYRGTVKQRLYILHGRERSEAAASISPMTTVLDMENRKIGKILAAQHYAEENLALAVLDVECCNQLIDSGNALVKLEDAHGEFTLSKPPYPIPD